MLSGIGVGLAPAWSATRVQAASAQRSTGNDASHGEWRRRAGRVIVAGQVAVSLVLLVVALLFVRTVVNLRNTDLGFATSDVLTVRLEPPGSGQKWLYAERLNALYGDVLARVRELPGVKTASLSAETPLSADELLQAPVRVAGYVAPAGERPSIRLVSVFTGYFESLGIPLITGRDLLPSETTLGGPAVAVVNRAMAERYYGTTDVIGRQFTDGWLNQSFRIVGVAEDVRDRSIRQPAVPTAYLSFLRTPSKWGQMTLLTYANAGPPDLPVQLQRAIRDLEPNTAALVVERLDARLADATRQERMLAGVSGLFALLGALLAGVGVYGVVSYSASRRTVEFGVRMALGAQSADVRGLVLRETAGMLGIGAFVGLLGAAGAASALGTMFFGLADFDLVSFVAAAAGLGALAFVAAWLPARRSARLDPVDVLRTQ